MLLLPLPLPMPDAHAPTAAVVPLYSPLPRGSPLFAAARARAATPCRRRRGSPLLVAGRARHGYPPLSLCDCLFPSIEKNYCDCVR